MMVSNPLFRLVGGPERQWADQRRVAPGICEVDQLCSGEREGEREREREKRREEKREEKRERESERVWPLCGLFGRLHGTATTTR